MHEFTPLGFGCGLRPTHYSHFLDGPPSSVEWVEVIAENFLPWSDGRSLRSFEKLEAVRKHLPVVVHGVSLSLGSVDSLDFDHLKRVKTLLNRIGASWFSDHLCWTGVDGNNKHDLLPLPYTEEALKLVCRKIGETQDFLGRRILVENVSSYLTYSSSTFTEWDFLKEVATTTGCGLLVDINNIYVSSQNHSFDPLSYLRALPSESVGQIHLAGHYDNGTLLVDTHDAPVCDAVWELYRDALALWGPRSTMIEWDDKIPEWSVLEKEILKAKHLKTEGHYANARRDPAPL
jgi:uncharacterized protein